MCIIAKMDQVFSKENKTLKKYWKIGKNTGKVREKSGNFVGPEKWEPCTTARSIHTYKASKFFFQELGLEAMPGVMKEADAAVQRSQDRIKQNTETIII